MDTINSQKIYVKIRNLDAPDHGAEGRSKDAETPRHGSLQENGQEGREKESETVRGRLLQTDCRPVGTEPQEENVCEDCGKSILDENIADRLAFFDNENCATCEARKFQAMHEYDEKQKSLDW